VQSRFNCVALDLIVHRAIETAGVCSGPEGAAASSRTVVRAVCRGHLTPDAGRTVVRSPAAVGGFESVIRHCVPRIESAGAGLSSGKGQQLVASQARTSQTNLSDLYVDICIGVDTTDKPCGVTLDVSFRRRVIVSKSVVMQPRLPIEDLSREARVVGPPDPFSCWQVYEL